MLKTEDYYEVRVEHEDGNIIHIAISEVEYDVEIKVIRANNSSKCEVEIDGYYEEEIESGDMVASFDSYLNVGTHELRVINTEDDDIYGTIFFDVTSDSYYEFEINCTDVEVEISARGEANGQQGEKGNEATADKDFLAEIEAAVLERMDTPTNTNRERRIAVDAELYQITPFAEKEFLDAQLKQLAIQYIDGLKLQKEASETEHDYEEPITWYEGLVTCYEVLNVLHQNYDFLTDNSKFITTYVSQLNEKQALLAAYKAVEEDLSEQCAGELVNDYDGTNMSLTFSNNTEYEYSTIWKITYFDINGTAVGTESTEVENICSGQNYTVYFYVPLPEKTDNYEFTAYFTNVILPDEDDEELFVAKGETSLMNFLDAASHNGYEIIDPQRDGSYVNAKAKKGSVTFSIQYMVENQKVYMVEVVLDIFGEIDSEYTDCIAGLAKALNPNIDSNVLNRAIEEALTTPNQRVIKSETLFLFDDDEGVFTVTH
ncbi:MAG: hypothetical protein IJ325_10135 [Clostridia bacterium]|nr:hypothetical protein [Clostridia bacterium]